MSWRARVRWPWLSLSLLYREGGSVKALLDAKSVITSITVASGLGSTSAYTWLKLPAVDDMERVMEATTLPALILGGAGKGNLDEDLVAWGKALQAPNVRGLVIGRSLLFLPTAMWRRQ